MAEATLDIVAIGNAIVDVIARADDALLEREGLARGSMRPIDEDRAAALYVHMGPAREISGGSAANTLAGMAMLGAKCGFIGQVADDQLGAVFAHDIRAHGIAFTTAARRGPPATGRCLILVTSDGQRTMNTCLGASQFLPAEAIDRDLIASASILYLEAYMWDPPEPRAAMRAAMAMARAAGRTIAFTLSAAFCVARHRADFHALIDGGAIDILFANEDEILTLVEGSDFDVAVAEIAAKVPLLVVTRSGKGAIAIENGVRCVVPAEPVAAVVDTTGAGDLFAAGFLTGWLRGRAVEESLCIGAIAAAEVISHFGARPEAKLDALIAAWLGRQCVEGTGGSRSS
jgi:sugar/nucleoside kinase (ribokinase family)